MTHPDRTEQLAADLFPTLPVCWAELNEVQTEDALEELADWVDWAVTRYALDHRVIPECWDSHGALIEELSALRTAWVAAHCVTGRPEAPLEWHANFDAARQRLTDWASRTGCRPGGEHRPDRA
ncbi:MAG TPA: hypothetical protein VHV82_08255 [Sporichthyaceae bacterium]|jgi:hypothetical protein|nr:hypothetical protein [Sporichthyaceae bacterium]